VISDAGAGVVVVVVSAGRSVVFIVGFLVGGLRVVVNTGFFVVVAAVGFGFVIGGVFVVDTGWLIGIMIIGFVVIVSGLVWVVGLLVVISGFV
jgi:hypothetical protein